MEGVEAHETLVEFIRGYEANKGKLKEPKEPEIVKGKRTGAGWKWLANIDMSIKVEE